MLGSLTSTGCGRYLERRRGGGSTSERTASCASRPNALSNGAPVAVGDALAELVDGLRPDWQTRAACRGLGAAGFFPKGAVVPEVTREVCEACGAAWDCLGYGLDGRVGRHLGRVRAYERWSAWE